MTDDPETAVLRDHAGAELRLPGLRLTVVEGPERGAEVVAHKGVIRIGSSPDSDLVLSDPGVSRRHLEVRLRGTDVRVVDLQSTNGTSIDGVRVFDALLGPASLVRVGASAIRASAIDEPVVIPLSARTELGALIGSSVAMREVFAILERVASTDATVLISGETGTGKELAAEAVHACSPRAEGPFVSIDCGAIPTALAESELFGHVRGAFTGALADRRGVFEEADGGTLFLDEIGELPLELQPKLLRALEKREVRRVGASRPVEVDVRIVAATNRDLAAEVNRGAFREDLYFRLAVVEARMPPLRSRREDVPMLVRRFAAQLAPDLPPPSPEVVRAMVARPWPGNVRELRNAVERACALASRGEEAAGPPEPNDGALHAAMHALFMRPIKEAQEEWLERLHRAYLRDVLRRANQSVSGAARLSGVNRKYIQRLMARYGMDTER